MRCVRRNCNDRSGSKPDPSLDFVMSASAECRHWSGRAVHWSSAQFCLAPATLIAARLWASLACQLHTAAVAFALSRAIEQQGDVVGLERDLDLAAQSAQAKCHDWPTQLRRAGHVAVPHVETDRYVDPVAAHQFWLQARLRFGRFLNFIPAGIIPANNLQRGRYAL